MHFAKILSRTAFVCMQLPVHSQALSYIIPRDTIAVLTNHAAVSLVSKFSYDFKISKTAVFTKPLESELMEIQSGLPEFLKRERPDIYKKLGRTYFQVACVQNGKERIVLINAFGKFITESSINWQTTPIAVDDGGNSFWRLCYSVQKKSFSKLSVNGTA